MAAITHAERLKRLLDKVVSNLDIRSPLLKAPSIAHALVEIPKFEKIWTAAIHCVEEIDAAYSISGKFSDKASKSAAPRLNRLTQCFSNKSILLHWNEFSGLHLTQTMTEDLETLDASLSDHGLFESFTETAIADLSKDVDALKEKLLSSDMNQRLKLSLHSLLNQMQAIFETHDLLGDQGLSDLTDRWAGALARCSEELKFEESTLRDDAVGLTKKLWGYMNNGAVTLRNSKEYLSAITTLFGKS